jgi:hypothetical protein
VLVSSLGEVGEGSNEGGGSKGADASEGSCIVCMEGGDKAGAMNVDTQLGVGV